MDIKFDEDTMKTITNLWNDSLGGLFEHSSVKIEELCWPQCGCNCCLLFCSSNVIAGCCCFISCLIVVICVVCHVRSPETVAAHNAATKQMSPEVKKQFDKVLLLMFRFLMMSMLTLLVLLACCCCCCCCCC